MPNPSANGPEPKPAADYAPPIALERAATAGVVAERRRIDSARSLSILRDASALRWRYGERLDDVIEDACRRFADRVAVDVENANISFAEFDARANRLARFFIAKGVKPGDRVAVLLDRGPEGYAALFALMKARAAYVPLDPNHPAGRIGYILRDASASLVFAELRVADRLADCAVPRLFLDKEQKEIAAASGAPLGDDERGSPADALCYVLYTSGTTGHPKGVAVAHPSICNFVRVAVERYGFGPGDRVYQGMSLAFDFSVEELWVPLVAGATLVPNTAPTSLFKVTLERPDLVRHLTPVRRLRTAPVVQARTRSRASSKPRPADGLLNVTEGPFWLLTVGQFRGHSGAIDSTADGAPRLAESSL